MKYGEQLNARSVPIWRAYNIDYNEIKALIKMATAEGGRGTSEVSEQDVFDTLKNELDAVNMFVLLKSGEIDRRIDDCEQLIDRLTSVNAEEEGQDSIRDAATYRLRRDIVRITRDVQSLSRFIGVQRTGFRKLLKKYNKWSHSTKMATYFSKFLDAPNSFANLDFTSKFLELGLLYDVLRGEAIGPVHQISYKGVSDAMAFPSNVQFDHEMVTLESNKSMFWVHIDNVMEVQVALLKSMRLVDDKRLKKVQSKVRVGSVSSCTLSSPDTSVTYLDDGKFIPGITGKEAGQIRWIKDNGSYLYAPTGGVRNFSSTKLDSNQLDMIVKGDFARQEIELESLGSAGRLALGWVAKKRVVPSATIESNRTRFVKATDPEDETEQVTNDNFVWACIDSNVNFVNGYKSSEGEDDGDDEGAVKFPYCILEIKWSGPRKYKPKIIKELDSLGLVQPVPGYSFFAHFVALFHKDKLEQLPSWFKYLDVDIRRGPSQNAGDSITSISAGAGSPFAGTRTPSGYCANSSTSSLNKPPAGSQLAIRYWNEFDNPEDEDDDAGFQVDYASDDGVFTDNTIDQLVTFSDKFVGHIKSAFGLENSNKHSIKRRHAKRMKKQNQNPDATYSSLDSTLTTPCEEQPLIFNADSATRLSKRSMDGINRKSKLRHCRRDGDEDEDSVDTLYSPRLKSSSAYQTFDNDNDAENALQEYLFDDDYYALRARRHDNVLCALYSVCFLLGCLMTSILLGVVLAEDLKQVGAGTFAFIVIGLIITLVIALLGLSLFLLRDIQPVWYHQTFVFIVFFTLVCLDVGTVAWLLV